MTLLSLSQGGTLLTWPRIVRSAGNCFSVCRHTSASSTVSMQNSNLAKQKTSDRSDFCLLSTVASPARGGWGRKGEGTAEANRFSVTGPVCYACANRGKFFLRTWGWGWSGWGESASSGVRCTSCFNGLARGIQESYTQIPGTSLKSWVQLPLSDMR